ncbi:Kunitz/Bovine pancreatic trypsin inhibitor domain protein [Trichostrongylus colubriformis]|uniref:Kunitz/Bovine pancreatic trypsin inhibitor domain protein n=1 Tax=Trichostrongylus colubriformis TaxID=6319 RepID=A0AAN8FDT4_TRICO
MKLIVVLLIVLVGNALSLKKRCMNKIDAERCGRVEIRYAYDSKIGKCTEFVWGGCQRNGNNFRTIHQCVKTCQNSTSY